MQRTPPTTIQATAKRYKLHMLLGVAAISVGVVAIVVAEPDGTAMLWGPLVALLGLAWYGGARLLAWWHHG